MSMLAKLILLFTAVPLVELFLLIQIGQLLGIFPTILIVIGTGVVGAFLARTQGLAVIKKLQDKLNHGGIPTDELLDGAILLVSGALLITPGLITDLLGFTGLIPPARTIIKRYGRKLIKRKVETEAGYVDVNYHSTSDDIDD